MEQVPRDVIVVLDEAYAEYVTDPEYPDGLSLLTEFPNLVVTRTFSKIYALAGLRLGYAVSHPDMAELLNRIARAKAAVLLPRDPDASARALPPGAYRMGVWAVEVDGFEILVGKGSADNDRLTFGVADHYAPRWMAAWLLRSMLALSSGAPPPAAMPVIGTRVRASTAISLFIPLPSLAPAWSCPSCCRRASAGRTRSTAQ